MAYTTREQALLNNCKLVIPGVFIAESSDDKILAFVDLVVNDINWWLPYTAYDRNSFPDQWFQTVILGTAYFSQLFKQMEATLQDFNYNDNGLSVNVDQVGKINTGMVNLLKAYGQQIDFIKKAMLLKLGSGIGTPRFQSQIGQFLKISLGQSFSWGSSPGG